MIERVKLAWAKSWRWVLSIGFVGTVTLLWQLWNSERERRKRDAEELAEMERLRARHERDTFRSLSTKDVLKAQADQHAKLSVEAGMRAEAAEAERLAAYERIARMNSRQERAERARQLDAYRKRKAGQGLRAIVFALACSSSTAYAQLPEHPTTPVTFDEDGKATVNGQAWNIVSQEELTALLTVGAELMAADKQVAELKTTGAQCAASNVELRVSLDVMEAAHSDAVDARYDAEASERTATWERDDAKSRLSRRTRWMLGLGFAAGVLATGALVWAVQ